MKSQERLLNRRKSELLCFARRKRDGRARRLSRILRDEERLGKGEKFLRSWKSDFLKAARSKRQAPCAFAVCQPRNFPAGLLSNFAGAAAGLPCRKFRYPQRKRDFFASRHLPRFRRSVLQDNAHTCPHTLLLSFFVRQANVMAI